MISMLALLVLMSTPANAEPYMWGVGPMVGTSLLPARYPSRAPNALDGTGYSFPGVRGDLALGGHGVLYLDRDSRLGARAGVGLGAGMVGGTFTLEYERIFTFDSGFHFLGGLGVGGGVQSFTDETDDRLDVSQLTLRTQLGAIYRDKTRAYELDLYALYNIPIEHRYTASGQDMEVIRGRGARYPGVGVEASVYFGDFTPPKAGRKGKGKGKGGRGGR